MARFGGEQRLAETRAAREAKTVETGVDYETVIGMSAEERTGVDIAAVEATKADVAEAAAQQVAASGAIGMSDMAMFAKMIATSIAELTAQHQPTQGRRAPIPASVLRARADAWEEMQALLDDIRRRVDRGDVQRPLYELTQPLFCDDELIPATRKEGNKEYPTRIRYSEVPNEWMVPKDALARQVHALYMQAIGGQSKDLGDVTYEAYLNRPRAAEVDGQMRQAPLLGTPKARHQSRAEVIDAPPEEGEARNVGPRKVLGTLQPELPTTL